MAYLDRLLQEHHNWNTNPVDVFAKLLDAYTTSYDDIPGKVNYYRSSLGNFFVLKTLDLMLAGKRFPKNKNWCHQEFAKNLLKKIVDSRIKNEERKNIEYQVPSDSKSINKIPENSQQINSLGQHIPQYSMTIGDIIHQLNEYTKKNDIYTDGKFLTLLNFYFSIYKVYKNYLNESLLKQIKTSRVEPGENNEIDFNWLKTTTEKNITLLERISYHPMHFKNNDDSIYYDEDTDKDTIEWDEFFNLTNLLMQSNYSQLEEKQKENFLEFMIRIFNALKTPYSNNQTVGHLYTIALVINSLTNSQVREEIINSFFRRIERDNKRDRINRNVDLKTDSSKWNIDLNRREKYLELLSYQFNYLTPGQQDQFLNYLSELENFIFFMKSPALLLSFLKKSIHLLPAIKLDKYVNLALRHCGTSDLDEEIVLILLNEIGQKYVKDFDITSYKFRHKRIEQIARGVLFIHLPKETQMQFLTQSFADLDKKDAIGLAAVLGDTPFRDLINCFQYLSCEQQVILSKKLLDYIELANDAQICLFTPFILSLVNEVLHISNESSLKILHQQFLDPLFTLLYERCNSLLKTDREGASHHVLPLFAIPAHTLLSQQQKKQLNDFMEMAFEKHFYELGGHVGAWYIDNVEQYQSSKAKYEMIEKIISLFDKVPDSKNINFRQQSDTFFLEPVVERFDKLIEKLSYGEKIVLSTHLTQKINNFRYNWTHLPNDFEQYRLNCLLRVMSTLNTSLYHYEKHFYEVERENILDSTLGGILPSPLIRLIKKM